MLRYHIALLLNLLNCFVQVIVFSLSHSFSMNSISKLCFWKLKHEIALVLNKLFPFQLCRWASLVLGRSSSHLKRKTIMLMDTLWCGCIPMHWFMSRRIMKSKWKICRVTSSSYNAKTYSLFLHRTKIEYIHHMAFFYKTLILKTQFQYNSFYE